MKIEGNGDLLNRIIRQGKSNEKEAALRGLSREAATNRLQTEGAGRSEEKNISVTMSNMIREANKPDQQSGAARAERLSELAAKLENGLYQVDTGKLAAAMLDTKV